ncbi:MAG: DUF1269 domain-containing protein [Devosia sp.]|uniref:DUF1269 domain-containing protein n=1 Tax=Devosia sp. TaxID=1871048 RepID=UPI001A04EC60|nr:DUF1269 domain-containing protein [Devosia sp.]MBF0678066.1 DUF1269 domain-containing protein [Devosia sp.]
MAEFIVLSFPEIARADDALSKLQRLQKEHLVDLEDAVVAIRDPEGKVHLKQSINLVGLGAATSGLSGAMWGSLVGLLFLNPLAGMAIGGALGAGSGALAGRLVDYGIADDLIKEIAENIKPGTSALFLLVKKAQPEKVLAELAQVGGTVIRSSLSPEQEERIQRELSAAAS